MSYRASYKTEGSTQPAAVLMNFAARYKMWGDQGNISLRVADPFKLQTYGYRTENGTVVETADKYNGVRAVFLTVSRNFGKAVKLQTRQQDPDAPTQGSAPPPN
jgi:hypothetical protein